MRFLESMQQADVTAFEWFTRYKHRETIVKAARLISLSADGPLYMLAGACFLYAHQWEVAKVLALGYLVERICYKLFKTLFKRNRPPEAIPGFTSIVEPADKFSFPSGHTSAAFLMTCVMAYFFPWTAWILIPWAMSVGMARVMLGVHFPGDVLAGATMGSSLCLLVVNLLF